MGISQIKYNLDIEVILEKIIATTGFTAGFRTSLRNFFLQKAVNPLKPYEKL
jgi:hypothetical protein